MADINKVLFGFKDFYIGTYTVDPVTGTVTLGTPYLQKGAVGFSPEDSSDQSTFWADDIPYYVTYSEAATEGDLTVAKFDDAFKEQFLGYVKLADGGLAQVKGATKPSVYLMFSVSGDQQGRKVIFYNGTLGAISREYSTIEETPEPVTESIPTSFVGDNATGIRKVTYNPGDAGYDTLFTNPPVPALPGGSD